MERYYFHIRRSDQIVRDEEGMELPDHEAVESEAKQSARDLIIERLKAGRKLDGDLIEVHDQSGAIIHVIKFSELLH
jgi:hypothetical protein